MRWGIVGTGYVSRKFVLGLRQSLGGKATLVFSRSADKGKAFAAQLGLDAAVQDLSAMANSNAVDAVYVASPVARHFDHAVAAVKAGKHVLVEKPFVQTGAEARELFRAAQEAKVFCMEGMWTLHLPVIAKLKSILDSGELGEIRSFQGSFGASTVVDAGQSVFNSSLGGGALAHRGIYPLALALHLLGPAQLLRAGATVSNGIDEDCTVLLQHSSGALSTLRASLRAALANDFSIEGTHGSLSVSAPVFRPFSFVVKRYSPAGFHAGGGPLERLKEGTLLQSLNQRFGRLARGRSKTIVAHFTGNGYHYQADEVARCVAAGKLASDVVTPANTVMAADIIGQAQRSWESLSGGDSA